MKFQIYPIFIILYSFSICLNQAEDKPIQDEVDLAFSKWKMYTYTIESIFSTPDEILGFLGPPLGKGSTAWTMGPLQETWSYFRHLDEHRFVAYTVYFPPKKEKEPERFMVQPTNATHFEYPGLTQLETVKKKTEPLRKCTVEEIYERRSEIEKEPLKTEHASILQTPNEPVKNEYTQCLIKTKDAYAPLLYPTNSIRVKGTPVKGGTVTIKHRAQQLNYNFLGKNSLRLESITFENGE